MRLILITLVLITMLAGCGEQLQTPDLQGYLGDYLKDYTVSEQTSVDILHWRNQYVEEPGVFHYCGDGGMYVMATYDNINRTNLEIENVKADDDEIVIYVVGGKPIDTHVGTVDYSTNVLYIENVQSAGRKVRIIKLADK